MNKIPCLSIVVPCYNEEEVLQETIKRLSEVLKDLINKGKISNNSFLLFVDDGSKDKTWDIVLTSSKYNNFVKGIKLSKNTGHQNALMAGMECVMDKCDCAITIDADLQDDVGVIEEFVDKYLNGADIVFGIRKNRENDSVFKKYSALAFYKMMELLGTSIVYNHADYRLMSKRVILSLLSFEERNLFLRGIVSNIGYKTDVVYYNRQPRFAGKTKYPLRKMLAFAWEGITSFSIMPLRIITAIGFAISLLTMFMGGVVLYITLFTDEAVPGWASTVLSIYFIGGVQLLSIGVIGEYIGKIYMEAKKRPRYLIEYYIDNENNR